MKQRELTELELKARMDGGLNGTRIVGELMEREFRAWLKLNAPEWVDEFEKADTEGTSEELESVYFEFITAVLKAYPHMD
jgi:hypothetical protein